MKKVLATILALSLLCLSACSHDSTPAVMTLDGHTVTEAMYSYWTSSCKGNYLYSYEDMSDTEEFWCSEVSEGVTAEEYFNGLVLDSVRDNLVCMMLFDKYSLELTGEEKSNIDDYISDLIKEYADSSKADFNAMLEEYGVNSDLLRDIYLEEAKLTKVYSYLYGDGGAEAVTDAEKEEYCDKNYVHMQIIYINNAYQYVTDENGAGVIDEDGYYKTEKLDAVKKAEKDASIAAVKLGLENGEDFGTLYEKYSELKSYPNGYYYAQNRNYSDDIFYRLVSEARELEIGGVAVIEGDSGTCIIKRLELEDGAWRDARNADFFPADGEDSFAYSVAQAKFAEKLKGYYDKINVDNAGISKISVATATPCYSF